MSERTGLRFAVPALLVALLAAACVSTPIQTTPRAEAPDPAGLELIGIVTVEGDTVRFDRPRADDPPSRQLEKPRVEDGEVRATFAGRPYRLPVERVAAWFHQEPESKRGLVIASAVAAVVVVASLVLVLAGGLD